MRWPIEWSRAGEVNGTRVVMLANGAGPDRAGEAVEVARRLCAAEAVVSTGFCGALDPELRIGEIFVATAILPEGFEVRAPKTKTAFASGPLLSIDRVAGTAGEKRALAASGARAVEMESAGVAARAREWGVPCFCIRSVSDRASEGFTLDFNACRRADGRFDESRILGQALRRPFRALPELARLYRQTRLAAGTLGDFLADCRF
ncbi:MAG: hypothetical protein ACRD96_27255 [Bryobacteraceae bacterium]